MPEGTAGPQMTGWLDEQRCARMSRSRGSEQGYIGRRESGDAYWNAERQAVEFGSRSESTVALSRSRRGCSNTCYRSGPPPSAASRRTTSSGPGSRASRSGNCAGAS